MPAEPDAGTLRLNPGEAYGLMCVAFNRGAHRAALRLAGVLRDGLAAGAFLTPKQIAITVHIELACKERHST